MRRKGISKLNATISYSKKMHCYRLVIDGDEFWCDTYEHSVCRLISILSRDEICYRFVLPKHNVKYNENVSALSYDDLPF